MNQNLKNSAQALLAMQRMSWEQGVAAQAFFEYGRPDIGTERKLSDVRLEAIRLSAPNAFVCVDVEGLVMDGVEVTG